MQLDIDLIKTYLKSNPATDRIAKIRRLPQHVKDNGEIFKELLKDKFVEGDDLRDFSQKLYEDEDFIFSCCTINPDIVNALRVSSKSKFALVEKAVSLNPKTIYYFEYVLDGHQKIISKIIDEAKTYFVLSLPINLKPLKQDILNAMSKKSKEYIAEGFQKRDTEAFLLERGNSKDYLETHPIFENLNIEGDILVSLLDNNFLRNHETKSNVFKDRISKELTLRLSLSKTTKQKDADSSKNRDRKLSYRR